MSVIVPTFNRRDRVVRAVESILGQEGVNLEVLVVDDGSADDTVAVLREQFGEDSRINVLSNAGPKGCCGARNTGLAAARGELIAFLDDDDEYLPGKLRADADAMREYTTSDVLLSGVRQEWCAIGNEAERWLELELTPNRLFESCYTVLRRCTAGHLRQRCNHMEWRDWAVQFYENRFQVRLVPDKAVRKHSTSGSLSKDEVSMVMEALANAEKYVGRARAPREAKWFRHYLAVCRKNAANLNLKRGHPFSAAMWYCRAFGAEPRLRNLVPFW